MKFFATFVDSYTIQFELIKVKRYLGIICFILIIQSAVSQNYYITIDGYTRQYHLHVPNSISEDASLIFVLHGYSGSAASIRDYTGFNQLADEYGFVVCYPQGLVDDWGNRFWNVGYDFHQNESVDDVGFLSALAQYLHDEYELNDQNTFCTGMSNGGDMCYLLACQASDMFKAVAPVAGCMMEWFYSTCNPSNPIPVLEIHGTDDDITYWEGDMYNHQGYGPYLPVLNTFDFWVQKNECAQSVVEVFPDIYPYDGSIVESTKFKKGLFNNEVWLYKVDSGGHDWPGSWGNMDIDATEEIWKFFTQVIQNGAQDINDKLIENDIKTGHNYPNPFNSATTIIYQLSNKSHVDLTIFDITGKVVAHLVNDIQDPGIKSVHWEAINSNGNPVKQGIYICKIEVRKTVQHLKMILVK